MLWLSWKLWITGHEALLASKSREVYANWSEQAVPRVAFHASLKWTGVLDIQQRIPRLEIDTRRNAIFSQFFGHIGLKLLPCGRSWFTAISSPSTAKNMAQNDRRTSYMSTNKPRVASSRAGESDSTARPRNDQSPLAAQMRGGASSSRGLSREYSSSNEKRIERTQTTTREKVQIRTRNPVKEPSNATNRGDVEKTRVKQRKSVV